MDPQVGQGVFRLWAWVELNYRPHAYQAASYEHELGSEVPTRLPFTKIALSTSRIYQHPAHFREHFAHVKGHHNGHHRDPAGELVFASTPVELM